MYQDRSSVDIQSLNITINVTTNTVDISSLTTFSLQQLLCRLVSRGTVVFVASISCEKLQFVSPVLSLMTVPLVNIGESCQEASSYYLDVIDYFDSKSEFELILSDIVQMLDWRDIFVIYDADSGLI